MPIQCSLRVRDISATEFDEIDRYVMRAAYDSQNELGRLCKEHVYENDIAARLRAQGSSAVFTQVPVTVSHGRFRKTYRLDLVVDHALYELKAVSVLAPDHDAQVLHYAMLIGVGHGKLINMHAPRVYGRLRYNAVSYDQRCQCVWRLERWRDATPCCPGLLDYLQSVVSDWGAFLDYRLYEEALIHYCGGEEACVDSVRLQRTGLDLGIQPHCFHAENWTFHVTALTGDLTDYESHLRRRLALTSLTGMQWFNFKHAEISAITIGQ